MPQPTIPQMLTRLNSGHTYILRVLAGRIEPRHLTLGEGRGAGVARATLMKWGCIQGANLTERGQQLLAEWEKRDAAHKEREAAIWNRLNNPIHGHSKALWS